MDLQNLSMRILIILSCHHEVFLNFELSFLMPLISSIEKSTFVFTLSVIKGRSDGNVLTLSIN